MEHKSEPSTPYWCEAFDDAWSEFEGERNERSRDAFTQGWHSRDAEVDYLRQQVEGWMHRALRGEIAAGADAEARGRCSACRDLGGEHTLTGDCRFRDREPHDSKSEGA